MTETPNDPAQTPEPQEGNGSQAHLNDDTSSATDATPTPDQSAAPASAEPTPDQSTDASADAPQASWAAPVAAQQNPQQQTPAQQQQPTGQQPTAAYPTDNYGTSAFGQPNQPGQPTQQHAYGAYGQQPSQQQPGQQQAHQQYAGQQYAGQQNYSSQQTGTTTRTTASTTDSQPKRRGVGLIVAALAVGALIGGASGAGVMGVFQATQNTSSKQSTSTGAQNITVNNAADATPVTAVAAKASPSVVTISVTASSEAGTGSGVVLSSDGYVLTNTHVVTLDGAVGDATIQVQDNDGKLYSAKVIGTDPTVDLAVIKLQGASGMTPATFADSSKLNVGDRAVAIGAPLGLSGTVTDGIVSALNRSIQIASSAAPKSDQPDQGSDGNLWNFDLPGQGDSQQQKSASATISLPVIQTDAAINPGNSGGALLNSKGQVIGINVAIASAGGTSSDSGAQTGSIGVGFAIPADLANRVADELKANGKATHGLLGATVKDAAAKSSDTVGATIVSVSNGGAAEKAGIKAGDVVTNFNGSPITSATDLTAQVRYLAGGASAKITYVRDGKANTVEVTLGQLSQ